MISAVKEDAPRLSERDRTTNVQHLVPEGGRQSTHSLEGIRELLLGQLDIGNHHGVWVGASLAKVNPADCDRARGEELSNKHCPCFDSLSFPISLLPCQSLSLPHPFIPLCLILHSVNQFALRWLSPMPLAPTSDDLPRKRRLTMWSGCKQGGEAYRCQV
jgi:hypothetical protein